MTLLFRFSYNDLQNIRKITVYRQYRTSEWFEFQLNPDNNVVISKTNNISIQKYIARGLCMFIYHQSGCMEVWLDSNAIPTITSSRLSNVLSLHQCTTDRPSTVCLCRWHVEYVLSAVASFMTHFTCAFEKKHYLLNFFSLTPSRRVFVMNMP